MLNQCLINASDKARNRSSQSAEDLLFTLQLIYAAFVTTYVVQGYYEPLYYIHYIAS